MQLNARAKVNWALSVLGKRPDGLHVLDMLMQSITLADTLQVYPGEELSLTIEGDGLAPGEIPDAGEGNLVIRAARELAGLAQVPCRARMHLIKRIPVGAGLGGGSADAAAALVGLCRLWQLDFPQDKLFELAFGLGADVPFCMRGGAARVGGAGERLRPVSAPHTPPMLIALPQERLSTGAVFSRCDAAPVPRMPDLDVLEHALATGRWADFQNVNALAPAACSLAAGIAPLLEGLRVDALACGMSGSGPAVWAVYAGEQQRLKAQKWLAERGIWFARVEPADAGVVLI
nr:4-(cytidine 5'-diphospho)-2-C-methyl-D-erythritol kinase [bacterium]